jgi:hypothetical protein
MRLQLQCCLDFICCECEGSIGVTVKCSGRGLAAGSRTVAAVRVPCPQCQVVNQVCFHPTGTVVDVSPAGQRGLMILPSLN